MNIKKLKDKKILFLGIGLTTYESAISLENYKDNIIITGNNLSGKYYEELLSKGFLILNEQEVLNNDYNIDYIIKSPGIPFDNQILLKYKNIDVINDIELAYQYIKLKNLKTKIIAVTGTNGKTTTTLFIEKLLSNASYNVASAGNIGISPLYVLNKDENLDFLILELSSFQLKNIKEFKPDYSFILNITPDHLNIHNSFEDYANSKKRIILNQKEDDYVFMKKKVLNNYFDKDYIVPKKVINEAEENIKNRISYINNNSVNFNNLILIYRLSKILNINDKIFFETVQEFKGLEHRVEFVEEIDNINYYNDSKATNLEAMKESLKKLNNVILLVGGSSKGQDLSSFDSYLSNVKHVITFGENKYEFISKKIIYRAKDLEEAMDIAKYIAQKNDTILLSPASASFDQYTNYKVRGHHFKKLIKEMR